MTKINLLKRKASRGQMRPTGDSEMDTNDQFDQNRFSLLLFLRDLSMNPERHAAFVKAINDAAGAQDESGVMYAIATAVRQLRRIGYDYVDAGNGKRRRLLMLGEEQAENELGEHDQLMDLARTVWADPNNPTDFIAEAYKRNLRPLPRGEEVSLNDLFNWARSWGEVRYRFMNHALRDDPVLYREFRRGRARKKGDAANSIVHHSNILEDCRLVEFRTVGNTGYSDADRKVFQNLYMLTPEEARQLVRFNANLTGLRAGLPAVFRFCVTFINAYIDWRVKMLTMARVRILESEALMRKTSSAQRRSETAKQNEVTAARIKSVDNLYRNKFMPRLRDLIRQAGEHNAFYRETYNELDSAVNQIRTALCDSPFNTAFPRLRNYTSYRRSLNKFPGANLVPPTGTSMILSRPRRR
ncbi:hypothetical protein GGS21DRAFT_260383 [Xylaria nigripes]|nr:hypothetical protein GGS21DRAFT_260383 [Xylaria nigripes]